MRRVLPLLVIGLMLISCGKKEVKPVSQESKVTQEAFALAEAVKNAFVAKDTITLQKNSTERGYKDITANTKTYDRVEISFNPRWVEIENNQLYINISWKSTWITASSSTEERGMAVFLMEGTPLKISRILRGNPFIYPGQ